jgi:hypothetical protein
MACRIGDWVFSLSPGPGKLEVLKAGRPDLAHLTIFWGTKSGQLDFHLTHNHQQKMSGFAEKEWTPLIAIDQRDLERWGLLISQTIASKVVPEVLAVHRKFRPGWLGHRGYLVMLAEPDEMMGWMRRVAPKSRGKYRIRPEQFLDPVNYPTGLVGNIYDPKVLKDLREELAEAGSDRPDILISAMRVHRRRVVPQDQIWLKYALGHDGTWGWWGTRYADFAPVRRLILKTFEDFLTPLLRPEHLDKFDQIVAGLGIAESDEGKRTAEGMRAFLRQRLCSEHAPSASTAIPAQNHHLL